ncbi:AraC family transcriptional regulator [Paenibacillus sp. 598K]|nr:AraC family transcriptional regulator [Paenibacillus sp. 598K]
MLLSVVIYHEASRALRNEIRESNEMLMEQLQEVMDKQMAEVMRLHLAITLDQQLRYLIFSNPSKAEAKYTTARVIEEFREMQVFNGLVDQFYVYWQAEDSLLMSGTYWTSRMGYDNLHAGGQLSYDQWHALLNKPGFRGFVSIPRIMADGSIDKSLAYVSSLSNGVNTIGAGSIVIMVDVNRLAQRVELFNRGDVFILNGDNEIILSNSDEEGERLTLSSSFEGERAFFYEKYKGTDSEVLHIQSRTADLKYVSIMPSRLVWEKAEYVRKFTYISVLISLIGAGALTYMFLRRNYRPVQQLVEILSHSSNETGSLESNEFGFIQRVVSNTLSEQEQIKLRLKLQNNVMRSNTLLRLLKGKLDGPVPLEEAMATFNIFFQSDEFAVILLALEDENMAIDRFHHVSLQDKAALLRFIISNVVQEVADQDQIGYVTEVDQGLACIVNFRTSADDKKEHLLHIAQAAQQFLHTQYHMELIIAISGVHDSLIGIAQAYQEAIEAMEYRVVMGKKEVILYDELQRAIHDQSNKAFYYPLQVEQRLINCIKIGSYEKAQSVLDEIKERNVGQSAVSIQLVKCLMFNLISTIMKTTNEMGTNEDRFVHDHVYWIDTIMESDTLQGMYAQLSLLLREVCEYMAVKLSEQAKQLRHQSVSDKVDQIRSFVRENYNDASLNISSIGEHFQLKPTYLSSLFKEQTGEGLLDFVNRVRIDEAKQILKTEACTVNEVAKRVGFNEAATFIRVFKKVEGITPGKFKAID